MTTRKHVPLIERVAYTAAGAVDYAVERTRKAFGTPGDRIRQVRHEIDEIAARGEKVAKRLRRQRTRRPATKARTRQRQRRTKAAS